MIKQIKEMKYTKEWCNICKKPCNIEERKPFLITSTCSNNELIICKACMDIALNEQNILPEDF